MALPMILGLRFVLRFFLSALIFGFLGPLHLFTPLSLLFGLIRELGLAFKLLLIPLLFDSGADDFQMLWVGRMHFYHALPNPSPELSEFSQY